MKDNERTVDAMENKEILRYKVGGLLYTPAVNDKAADKIKNGQFDSLTSVCFCLEDSIKDDALEFAESVLMNSLDKLRDMDENERPMIFVRIRTPQHLRAVHEKMYKQLDAVTGYVLPKFDLSNHDDYVRIIEDINRQSDKAFYAMPILESRMIADISTRTGTLQTIKQSVDSIKDSILNMRVGGNDFCNLYGLRRSQSQCIYDIGVIRDILIDIINVFAFDYVVSGPVWEYFGKESENGWAEGLRRELELDRLNGFIGKTAIHPSQLPLIYKSLQVKQDDLEDALSILNWKTDKLGVAKSGRANRMNEVKCHVNWAKKIAALGQIYGVREESSDEIHEQGAVKAC